MNILYEDEAIIVCEKEAGVATQTKQFGQNVIIIIMVLCVIKLLGKKKIPKILNTLNSNFKTKNFVL